MNDPLVAAFLQAFIALTGAIAFLLVVRTQLGQAKWGYLLGLAGQPAWLYATFTTGQFGMFAVSLVWTWVWGQGVWEYWLEKPVKGWARRFVR